MAFQVVQHRRLDSAETEIVGVALHLRLTEANCARVTMLGELIHHRTTGISECEQARDFVVGFAGGVVARASQPSVGEMGGAILRF